MHITCWYAAADSKWFVSIGSVLMKPNTILTLAGLTVKSAFNSYPVFFCFLCLYIASLVPWNNKMKLRRVYESYTKTCVFLGQADETSAN